MNTLDAFWRAGILSGRSVKINDRNATLGLSADFGVSDRKVALDGEGYFEVAKDNVKPFIISTEEIQTRVVGTTFNINNQLINQ